MFFVRRNRKANVPVENSVEPGSIDWYMEERRKDMAAERYVWWVFKQMGNDDTRKKLMEYNEFMNALVEEIFGPQKY